MMIYDDRSWIDKVKVKYQEIRDAVKWKIRKTIGWINQNPASAVKYFLMVLYATAFATSSARKLVREVNIQKEKRDEKCRVWDPVNGIQWETKKPLTNEQKLEFERRGDAGDNRGEILKDMKVLKRTRF